MARRRGRPVPDGPADAPPELIGAAVVEMWVDPAEFPPSYWQPGETERATWWLLTARRRQLDARWRWCEERGVPPKERMGYFAHARPVFRDYARFVEASRHQAR